MDIPRSAIKVPASARKGGLATPGVLGSAKQDAVIGLVRVRPRRATDRQPSCVQKEPGQKTEIHMRDVNGEETKRFTFDYVADENTTQEEMFQIAGLPLIDNALQGINSSIYAYGQTGAGKTYTMMGLSDGQGDITSEVRGLIPRLLEYLFHVIQHQKKANNMTFMTRCSFLEIYNDQIFDLLEPASQNLQLRQDINMGVFVDGLREFGVENASDAMAVLNAGSEHRRVASTSMNRESSRSHAVFTLIIQSKGEKNGLTVSKEARLNLIDLAGSERQKHTGATGSTLREACKINQSLSTLGKVIMALVDRARGMERHVPYRESILTHLLKDSLGGNSKTYIIANVSQDPAHFAETLSTLQFVNRAKLIKNRAVINENVTADVGLLQAEVQRLRQQLASVEAGSGAIPNGRVKEIEAILAGTISEKERIAHGADSAERRVKELQEAIIRHERVQQQLRMQLKMREARQKVDFDEPTIVTQLKEELKALQHTIDHHPEVLTYADRCRMLEEELVALKEQYPTHSRDNVILLDQRQHIIKLERELKYRFDMDMAATEAALATPAKGRRSTSRTSDAHTEFKKWKQLQELEKALETTRDDLAQANHQAQEARREAERLAAEMEAQQAADAATIAELENMLKAAQLRGLMEGRLSLGGSLSGTAETHNQQIEDLQNVKEELERMVQDKEAEVLRMAQQLKKQTCLLESQQARESKQVDQYEAAAAKLKADLTATLASLTEKEKQLAVADAESTDWAKCAEEAQAALKIATDELEKLRHTHETQVAEMEMEISQHKDKVESLTSELQELQSALESAEADNNYLQGALHAAEARTIEEAEALAAATADLQASRQRSEQERERAEGLQRELQGMGETERRLAEVMAGAQATADTLRETEAALEATVGELDRAKTEVQQERDKVAMLCQQMEAGRATLCQYMGGIQQLRMQVSGLETERNVLKEELSETTRQQSHLEGLRIRLEKQIREMTQERDAESEESGRLMEETLHEAAQQKAEAAAHITALQDELNQQRTSFTQLQKDFDEAKARHASEIQTLQAQLLAAATQVNERQAAVAAAQVSLAEKDQLLAELRKEMEMESNDLSAHAAALRDLRAKHDELAVQYQNACKERDANNAKHQREQASFSQLSQEWEKTLATKNAKIAALSDQASRAEESASEASGQVSQLQQQVTELTSQLLDVTEQARAQQEVVARWQTMKLEYEEKLAVTTARLEATETALTQERVNCQIAQSENEEFLARLDAKNDEIDSQFQQLQELKSEMEKMKEMRLHKANEAKQLQAQMEKLQQENMILAGHSNTQQKIHYLQGVKNDYAELQKLKNRIEKHKNRLEHDNNILRSLCEQNGIVPPPPTSAPSTTKNTVVNTVKEVVVNAKEMVGNAAAKTQAAVNKATTAAVRKRPTVGESKENVLPK